MSKVTERDVMLVDPIMLHNAIVRAECKRARELDKRLDELLRKLRKTGER